MEQRPTAVLDPRGTAEGSAILAEDLRRTFRRKTALDGVSLAVQPGEIYGFLGPNGAGKSTLVRTLCTLQVPSSGRAVVAGFDVVRDPVRVRLRIGAALQATALDDLQTGNELLRMQCRFYGMSREQTERRLGELRELIDLGDSLDQRVGGYSGGMRRRLDVALAFVHDPSVLFLDEPTTGLDPASREALWNEIRRINTELGTTIFLTTQYLREADELASRVGIIDNGRLVAEDTPDALKRSVGTDVVVADVAGDAEAARAALTGLTCVEQVGIAGSEVTVSVTDGPTSISPVAVALAEARVEVHDLVLRRPTLDDVFLSLTGRHIGPPAGEGPEPQTAAEPEVAAR